MTTTVDGKKRCGDNEKRLIKEWAVANNGMKTQDEFYLTQLGKQLQEQGFGSRSIAPVVIHANKEVQKSQMGPNGIGVGAKRPPEDGITGMSLNGDEGNKKPKSITDHGNMVSPLPEDGGSFSFLAIGLAPSYAYNEKSWEPEVRKWTTVETVGKISFTIVWHRVMLASGCVQKNNVGENIDVDVINDGMTLQVKTKRPGQSVDPSRNHAIEMKKKQHDISVAAAKAEDLASFFLEYNTMVIRKKAEMAVVEEERVRFKENHKWNFLRIPLDKQCDTDIHYNYVHLGDTESEGHSVLIGLKEVKDDIYHEKKAMGIKMKAASPQSTRDNSTGDRSQTA